MIDDGERETMRSHIGRRRDLKRRRGRPGTNTLILFAMIVASWLACARLLILHRDLSERVAELESRKQPVPSAALTVNWTPWLARFAVVNDNLLMCRQRIEDLHAVLETLINVDRWPGRKRLPSPVSDWKPWPIWGVGIGDIHDLPPDWDGTDESMLKWQARKKKRSP